MTRWLICFPLGDMSPLDSTPISPAAQDRLFGHQLAQATLARAAASGRLAHAWLFSGPEGIGKASLAYRFARHLLSGDAGTAEEGLNGPGQDLSSKTFRLIAGEAHPDLLTVRRPQAAEGSGRSAKRPQDLPIDQIRKIPAFLSLAASEGGWRVVIVDEADRLNRNSANALLKVLEEPPDRTLLVLITEMPGRLMPTIRSRCRRLTLSPLSDQEMAAWLEHSQHQTDDADRDGLLALANGSPGRLVKLIETDALTAAKTLDSILSSPGQMDWGSVHKLSESLARPDAEARYELSVQLLLDKLESAVRGAARGATDQATSWAGGGSNTAQLDRLLQVWDKARDLFATAKSANLDKRTVLIQVFAAVESVAKAR